MIHNLPSTFFVEPVYYDTSISKFRYARSYVCKLLNIDTSLLDDEVVDASIGDIFLGLDLVHFLPTNTLKEWKDIGVDINFVIYDILPVQFPSFFPLMTEEVHHAWLETVLKISNKVICISKAVRDDVKKYYDSSDIDNKNIGFEYFYLGADLENSNPSKGLPQNANTVIDHITNNRTFLMVSTVEPRKGYLQTLKAFELLWEGGVNVSLMIVGKEGWMVDELVKRIRNHKELNKRLFWLEGISDEYLEKIYAAATCLIAASEGEGFGLPLIEAAQHKKPIIARDIPVFREVAGDYAYYFENSLNPEVIKKAVLSWLELYEAGKHPKSDDMPYLTWEESARMILNALNV